MVYKVQQRGLCPAAKLRGQGKGGCACRFCAMKGTCFFTEDVLKRTFCLGQHFKNVGPF